MRVATLMPFLIDQKEIVFVDLSTKIAYKIDGEIVQSQELDNFITSQLNFNIPKVSIDELLKSRKTLDNA